jgi:hypothetical protein
MEENTKTNIWLKLIAGGGRYILGILIIASGFLTLLFFGKDPTIIAHAIVHPLLTFFVTPQIIIGFYFMFTAKWRLRIDLTLILVAAVLIYAFTSFALGFNT